MVMNKTRFQNDIKSGRNLFSQILLKVKYQYIAKINKLDKNYHKILTNNFNYSDSTSQFSSIFNGNFSEFISVNHALLHIENTICALDQFRNFPAELLPSDDIESEIINKLLSFCLSLKIETFVKIRSIYEDLSDQRLEITPHHILDALILKYKD